MTGASNHHQSNVPETVALFATCLVDGLRPQIGWDTVALLRACGLGVDVPKAQTCCGQPAFNSGHNAGARALAAKIVSTFSAYDTIICPSGSCARMLAHHIPELLHATRYQDQARRFGAGVWELSQFLATYVGARARKSLPSLSPRERMDGSSATVTYHDSCTGLRELGLKTEPRTLLRDHSDITLVEHSEAETCCGFGGVFCVKNPHISAAMTQRKITSIGETGATTVVGTDLGCLLTIHAQARRQDLPLRSLHVAEVLAQSLPPAATQPLP